MGSSHPAGALLSPRCRARTERRSAALLSRRLTAISTAVGFMPPAACRHSQRVEVHVQAQIKGPGLVLHNNIPEPALPQGSHTLMTRVEPAGVRTVKPLHPLAQIGIGRLDNQVMVVIHQRIGVDRYGTGR